MTVDSVSSSVSAEAGTPASAIASPMSSTRWLSKRFRTDRFTEMPRSSPASRHARHWASASRTT